jgi:subtilisin-like proprotein convertase family protein
MRTLLLLFLIAATPAAGAPSAEALARRLDPGDAGARIEIRGDGRVANVSGMAVRLQGDPAESARQAAVLYGDLLKDPADGTTLEVMRVRETLTGTVVQLVHRFGGEIILGSGAVLRFAPSGELAGIENGVAVRKPTEKLAANARATADPQELAGRRVIGRSSVLIQHDGEVRRATRILADDPPFGEIAFDVDPVTGALLQTIPLYWLAPAKVFISNPVTSLNDPSLQDNDDSPLAVPENAYSWVELPDLGPGPGLVGPRVAVMDLEAPKTASPDPGTSLAFDRGNPFFEEVMAYYHLDAAVRYVEGLGYVGTRRIFRAPLRVDAHAAGGADQSFYRLGPNGEGTLFFGDGGVDDAEDPDILLHEFGHALQDAIALFAFAGSYGSQARAIGEGFGDFWAFSTGYEASRDSGRDPYCIGDWDARCWGGPSTSCGYPVGANCLRRVDSNKTIADYIFREQSGVEHQNGEIWSSALREILIAAVSREGLETGRRMIDTVVVESHFGVPPQPTFRSLARRMLEADRLLYGGVNRASICGAMIGRGILTASDCELVPRGGYTTYQSPDFERAIPDNDAGGLISTRYIDSERTIVGLRVQLHVRHPYRGELRIHLTGPNGRTIILQAPNADSGADIDTVFGLDLEPRESFAAFHGIPARGNWTLQIIDTRALDVGSLVSWSLQFLFEGDAPAVERPRSGGSRIIPAIAHAPGAGGTFFISDVRLLNRGNAEAMVSAIYTASGNDGSSQFASIDLAISPGQQVSLDDLVDSRFRSAGVGTLEIRGDVNDLIVASRTYNDSPLGTFGQFVPAVSVEDATVAGGEPIHVLDLRNDAAFRSNLGFVDLTGEGGPISWVLFDEAGRPIEEGSLMLAPHGHAQVPILGGIGGATHPLARAEVRLAGGAARIGAYGSVVDNRTGDAMFIPASSSRTVDVMTVPAVIRGDGAEGTRWRSDLWLSNLSSEGITFTLDWHDAAGRIRSHSFLMLRGHSIRIEDVLADVWQAETGSGLLRLRSSAPGWGASSRAWTPREGGTYGQWIPAELDREAAGNGDRALAIAQLARTGSLRTNLGVAEITGAPVTVRIVVKDAGGRELWAGLERLAGFEQRQLSLALAGAPEFPNGYAWIEVVEGDGRVLAYGSVIDNRSGDPIFVPAVR